MDYIEARLVAKGYSQIAGVDYDETFASVVKMESLRMLLPIAATENLAVRQVDIKTAFLMVTGMKKFICNFQSNTTTRR